MTEHASTAFVRSAIKGDTLWVLNRDTGDWSLETVVEATDKSVTAGGHVFNRDGYEFVKGSDAYLTEYKAMGETERSNYETWQRHESKMKELVAKLWPEPDKLDPRRFGHYEAGKYMSRIVHFRTKDDGVQEIAAGHENVVEDIARLP